MLTRVHSYPARQVSRECLVSFGRQMRFTVCPSAELNTTCKPPQAFYRFSTCQFVQQDLVRQNLEILNRTGISQKNTFTVFDGISPVTFNIAIGDGLKNTVGQMDMGINIGTTLKVTFTLRCGYLQRESGYDLKKQQHSIRKLKMEIK